MKTIERERDYFGVDIEKTISAILNHNVSYLKINEKKLREIVRNKPRTIFEAAKIAGVEVINKNVDEIDIEKTIKAISLFVKIDEPKVRAEIEKDIMFIFILARDLHTPIMYKRTKKMKK